MLCRILRSFFKRINGFPMIDYLEKVAKGTVKDLLVPVKVRIRRLAIIIHFKLPQNSFDIDEGLSSLFLDILFEMWPSKSMNEDHNKCDARKLPHTQYRPSHKAGSPHSPSHTYS